MKRLILILALLLPAAAPAETISVAAVNAPLAYFAKRIGGASVDVIFPVPEGGDPALWRPGIADIAAIQGADLILLNGAGYAAWTAKTSLPRARIAITSGAFEDRFIPVSSGVTHSHGPEGEHSHTGVASVTWLDFAQAAAQAAAVRDALARLLPDETARMMTEADALAAELSALDARARTVAARLGGPVIASHPRYEYFARAYGLEVSALQWPAGADPGTDDLASLDALIAASPATVFLWETTPTDAAAAAVAARGLRGAVFDPGANARGDFVALMSQNLDALERVAD